MPYFALIVLILLCGFIQVYPQLEEMKAALPPGSFITCSSDNTIRIWNIDPHMDTEIVKRNIYSQVTQPVFDSQFYTINRISVILSILKVAYPIYLMIAITAVYVNTGMLILLFDLDLNRNSLRSSTLTKT